MSRLPSARLITAIASLFLVAGHVVAAVPRIAESPFPKEPPSNLILDKDKNIYDNQKAFDLVMQARTFDPQSARQENRNRDRAIDLYREAIAAQPGAKVNAALSNRIAQMYAFLLAPAAGVKPNEELAKAWYLQCLEFSDDRQLIWVQAQSGLVSLALIARDQKSVQERCEKIMAVDPQKLGLPVYKDWSRTGPDEVAAELKRQIDDLQQMQKIAAERLDTIRKANANKPIVPPKPAASLPAAPVPPAATTAASQPR